MSSARSMNAAVSRESFADQAVDFFLGMFVTVKVPQRSRFRGSLAVDTDHRVSFVTAI